MKGTEDPDAELKSRDRVLTPDELRTIWNVCRDDDFSRIIRLLILTGARRAEIGGLRWSEIDFDREMLLVPGSRTKNHTDLKLPLSPDAMKILRDAPRREGREFVFGHRGGEFCAWGHCTLVFTTRIAVTVGKFEPWRIHDIRRTVATGLAEIGILPHVIECVLNHTGGFRGGVSGTYIRSSYEREVRAALIQWADHIRSIVDSGDRKILPLRAKEVPA